LRLSEKRKDRLYVVMECGDIDLASFMLNKTEQIDDKFIKYHWQEMLKCVQVIHDKSEFDSNSCTINISSPLFN
jgi:succinate dehydrogenase flavin-adding protein (antitoxin of CptAB toxin-antitoxin module)